MPRKELKQVETFKYLGAIITENGDCSKEIQARLGAARGAVRSLTLCGKTGPYMSRLNKGFCQH